MTITTRQAKGSALTWGELDGNFTDLDARTAVMWQNLRGDMIADGIANAPPMRLFNSTLYMRAFSADVEQELSAIFHITKDYQAGTDIYPHGHITTPTASAGVVRWKITVSWANEYESSATPPAADEIFSTPMTFYVNQTIDASHTNAHLLIEAPTPLSLAALRPDSIILMRVIRDATDPADTYPDEIYLSMVDMYYQSQGFGEATR